MKKAYKIFLIFLSCMSLQSLCFAFQNEPNGFKGFEWGQTLEHVKEARGKYNVQFSKRAGAFDVYFVVLKDGDRYTYRQYAEAVNVSFWQNQLCRTETYFTNYNKNSEDYNALKGFELLRKAAIQTFGPPNINKRIDAYRTELQWLGETTQISLLYDTGDHDSIVPHVKLTFSSSKLMEQAKNDRNEYQW